MNLPIYPYMKLLKFNFLYNYNYTSFSLKNQIYNQMFHITRERIIFIDNMYETKFLDIVDEVSGKKMYKKKVMSLDLFLCDEEYVSICIHKGYRKKTSFQVQPDNNYLIQCY